MAKLIVIAVPEITTPKAVILRMRNVMLLESEVTYLEFARQKERETTTSQ